jgi:hypothetical protein
MHRFTPYPLLEKLRNTTLSSAMLGGLAATGIFAAAPLAEVAKPSPAKAQATPSLLEFRWEDNRDYRKLYYFQSSSRKLQRAEYYFFLRPKDRRNAILKLTIDVPDHFKAKIDPKKIKLCKMQLGSMLARSKCLETLPASIEVNDSQTSIEVFPETPLPADETTYAVVMNIFNPNSAGMFQFNALAQAPGDVPVSGYLGSWSIDIDVD